MNTPKSNHKTSLLLGAVCGVLFIILIALLRTVDIAPIGPEGSQVGLSTINGSIRDILGQNQCWYKVTKYIGYLIIASFGIYGCIGLCQLLKHKSLKKLDPRLWWLASVCICFAFFYGLFEVIVINCRPVLDDGVLKASFPSTHSCLAVALFGASAVVAGNWLRQLGHATLGKLSTACHWLLIAICVFGRQLSGVHWFTDILGGVLLGAAILLFFYAWDGPRNTKQTDQ